jgi:hypothetical protein
MDGQVQLSSAEGKRTAKILDQVAESLGAPQRALIERISEPIRNLPRNMVAEHNRSKAASRKPHIAKDAAPYEDWFYGERRALNEEVNTVFQDIKIREAVVEEMLTGRKQFAGTKGVAEYILTPKYFKFIDKKYVQNIAECVRIDVRGKSRSGFSFGVVRFDSKI